MSAIVHDNGENFQLICVWWSQFGPVLLFATIRPAQPTIRFLRVALATARYGAPRTPACFLRAPTVERSYDDRAMQQCIPENSGSAARSCPRSGVAGSEAARDARPT